MNSEIYKILDCVTQLDKVVGKTTHKDIVDVSYPCTTTWEDRQQLVRQMSIDMGLPFDFRVQSIPLAPGVAAEIKLFNVGSVVDVKTCPDLHYYPWSYYSAVCHELSHMYLKYHHLDYKDELLTDVCTIYLGFGGYMLNGKIAAKRYMDMGGCLRAICSLSINIWLFVHTTAIVCLSVHMPIA